MSFTEWLVAQQHRVDDVGALAAYVAADDRWPHAGSYRNQREHLFTLRELDLIPALHAAYGEWRETGD